MLPRRVPLGPDEIHLWLVSLDRPPAPLPTLQSTLSSDERERASRYHFDRDRRRYATSRGVLRAILASYLELDPDALTFQYSPHGKPSLAADAELRFNLSRSGEQLLVGVNLNREIGVDVECLRPMSDLDAIARRFFAPTEAAKLAALPDAVRTRAFFECWTRKEAFIKAVGEGLSMPLDSFEVAFGPDTLAALLSVGGSEPSAREWSLWGVEPAANVLAAVALQGPGPTLRTLCWSRRSGVVDAAIATQRRSDG
jgi:4'-phosphopantetheinyl transferase